VIITLDFLVEAVGTGTNITFIIVSPYIDEVATLVFPGDSKGVTVQILSRSLEGKLTVCLCLLKEKSNVRVPSPSFKISYVLLLIDHS
jgi:hypothetical protein